MQIRPFLIVVLILLLVAPTAFCQSVDNGSPFQQAEKQRREGNFKDALDLYEQVIGNPNSDPDQTASSLTNAVVCMQRLGRLKEADGLIEKAVELHQDQWRVLYRAAETYFSMDHNGCRISGKFERGPHRGGCEYLHSQERDRVRALQLMKQALDILPDDVDKSDASNLCFRFADMVQGYGGLNEAWRFQYATGLEVLPDYEEVYWRHYGYENNRTPVDSDGNPIFYSIPESFEKAANDGERYRWLLDHAITLNPKAKNQALWEYARFLHEQFGVETLTRASLLAGAMEGGMEKDGPFSVHTLPENETIASLASGVKRFTLPREHNYIAIYKQIEKNGGSYAQNALESLAQIFENRRQYPKAVKYRKDLIKRFPNSKKEQDKKLMQLTGALGEFESCAPQPAGREAEVGFTFRNGKMVHFKAVEVDEKKLVKDVKAYIRDAKKGIPDFDNISVSNVAYRILTEKQTQYLGKTAAEWDLSLEPNKDHFDKRVSVKTPLKKAGGYLLTSQMENGNASSIIVRIEDTAIVKKNMDGRDLYFVSDAATGEPLAGMRVSFFWFIFTGSDKKFKFGEVVKTTDRNGMASIEDRQERGTYGLIVTAENADGRFAHFEDYGSWWSRTHFDNLDQTRAFGITDRPVYRPGQTVHYKFWVRQARYDLGEKSTFAGRAMEVKGNDPRGTDIINETMVADEYGGVEGEYTLPDEAPLGRYYVHLGSHGSISFRVEEYKKPEFEVKVEAPKEPIALGETIPVEVKADYYFGAPVQEAKVTYKVLRSEYNQGWFPWGAWDWLYGAGYWWFGYDYDWYPGWTKWGCNRPRWSWWWSGSRMPPEVVAEGQGLTDENGVLKLPIDTALAKELRGDTDHRYEITVEVTDQSRRTIVGKGSVIAARNPFKVYAWVNKGHYQVGDVVKADFSAQTPDGKPVSGQGKAVLYKVTRKNGEPSEKAVKEWDLKVGNDGRAELKLDASKAGQYRISLSVTDAKGRTIEGGYVFCVMGDKDTGKNFVFDHLELVPDLREYAPGDKVRLRINTRAKGSTVLLFVRPENGVYPEPKILRINGNSTVQEIEVYKKDMPNFFVEALTVHDGKVYSETRQIVVPPENRVCNVEVLPSSEKYKPGEKAKIDLRLTGMDGEPFKGSTVLTVYDKAVEYISGGSNVQDIRDYFWKWVRSHFPRTSNNVSANEYQVTPLGSVSMEPIGVFGSIPAPGEKLVLFRKATKSKSNVLRSARIGETDIIPVSYAAAPQLEAMADEAAAGAGASEEAVHVRTEFADTAFWAGSLETDEKGHAQVEFDMPENLTAWKIKVWAMGHGTRVGQGEAEVVTSKDLLLRLQAPRFFVQGDEVVLSANIHNYLDDRVSVRAVLEVEGDCLELERGANKILPLDPNSEKRVDWRVKVVKEGEAIVRMKAISARESDAMEMRFPVYVHGMEKTETFSGVIRPDQNSGAFTIDVPQARRPEASRLEVRYSPTLAGAMIDALPYLANYPYGCTEQTLNRFLPTAITLNLLETKGVDLKALKDKHTNLNAQEMGDPAERAAQWKQWDENPVYDPAKVRDMVREGVDKLASMQNSDGGWGWFSGRGERSYPHTTATVVRGLRKARVAGAEVSDIVRLKGLLWLDRYEEEQLTKLNNAASKTKPYKTYADNTDAYIFMILAQAGRGNQAMKDYLMRDKTRLSVYGLTLLGAGLQAMEEREDLARVMKNISQYLVCDDENQTCYLEMGSGGYWWYWYGDQMEANAWYLKLLAATGFARDNDLQNQAAGLVKYILNNRKHGARWKSTRDTALCIEALADYLKASGEDAPDMKIAVYVDGVLKKEVAVNQSNLLDFDNVLVLEGDEISSGKHEIRVERKGKGPVYFNAWMSNFTLEDDIKAAGLEIKVNRKVYLLKPVDKTIKDAGAHGQVLDRKVEKYERVELSNLDMLQSGDLVEVELTVQSKNDYEYLVFEDYKPAGFEPVEVRSGYTGAGMGAYVEYRDERVAFFCRSVLRGTHNLSYRMRAEIPGRFSALPAKAHAMYAPELKANSGEIKLQVAD
ncbi:alpha-2-macroglobulin domain protein [Desulfatibacillum aliphaticivorans]|uniref:Alpha-2-macroglobulin domain protein n=1 Tax=Desulfatibacillum aliphaticivorans TaxID=218208 RepID=B8FAI6_DESAL|nr:MG2 domain-containing protein [Desulfatibacillum aliphaticivorans]ACL03282.1 alpha-2-macroglobulin domain protein [Desulfatibacillum aliphaticivorans]